MLIRSLTAAAAVFLAIPGLGSFANVGDVYDGIEKASGYKLTGENRKQAARLSWEIAQEQVRLKRDEFLGMNRNDQSGFSVSYLTAKGINSDSPVVRAGTQAFGFKISG